MNKIFETIKIFIILFKKVMYKRLLTSFSSIFGGFWLFLELASFFFPEKLKFGLSGYLALAGISFIIALIKNRPRRSFSNRLSSPDVEIEVKIGDLFDEKSHLVIGFNDVFDTEIGDIIKSSSIQGQFLSKIYQNDCNKLDYEINQELKIHDSQCKYESNKTQGKTWRYPIGTTITLGSEKRRYFLVAYGYMSNNLVIQSNPSNILKSLNELWDEVRNKCHGYPVAIPLIGTDISRSGLSRMQSIKLIITSFILASKKEYITKKLIVTIYPEDLESIDFYLIEEFLSSVCF
jgi:hypothetical protein